MTSTNTQSLAVNPALTEMGIKNAEEIVSYTLRPDGGQKDVLKIRYRRAKGSFLPQSRTYKFGRSMRTVIADGGTARMEHQYEISPFLLKAVAELDALIPHQKGGVIAPTETVIGQERVHELLQQFNDLETLVSGNIPVTEAATVAARFARLRAQLSAL